MKQQEEPSKALLSLGLGLAALGGLLLCGSFFLPILRVIEGTEIFLIPPQKHFLLRVWIGMVSLGGGAVFVASLVWLFSLQKTPPPLLRFIVWLGCLLGLVAGLLLHGGVLFHLPEMFWSFTSKSSFAALATFYKWEPLRAMHWASYAVCWWIPAIFLVRAFFHSNKPLWRLSRVIWTLGLIYLISLFVLYLLIWHSTYNTNHFYSFGSPFRINVTGNLMVMFAASAMLVGGGVIAERLVDRPPPLKHSLHWKGSIVALIVSLGLLLGYRYGALPAWVNSILQKEYFPNKRGKVSSLQLFEIGPTIIPILFQKLQDKDWKKRYAAIRAFEPFLFRKIKYNTLCDRFFHLAHYDRTPPVRIIALQQLGSLQTKKALQFLATRAQHDQNVHVRVAAVKALAQQQGELVMPMVAKAVKEDRMDIRNSAVLGLLKWKKKQSMVVYALLNALSDQRQIIRDTAIIGLKKGPSPEVAVAALSAALRNKNEEIQGKVAKALGALGPAAATAVPVLLKVFHAGSNETKVVVTEAFGALGPTAAKAIPVLKNTLRKMECRVLAHAFLCEKISKALTKIAPKHRSQRRRPHPK